MPNPLETFAHLTEVVAAVVATEPDPRAETPCPDWNYAQVLGHLVSGDRLFAGILTGAATPPSGPRPTLDPDAPPPGAADYRSASSALLALLADEAVQATTFPAPVGPLAGREVVTLRAVEHLLHGWDLFVSSGADRSPLESPAAALAEPAGRLLAAVGDATLARRRPFADPVRVDDDASTLDRLIAGFGRDPRWTPDPAAAYERVMEHFADRPEVEIPDGTRRGYGAMGLRIDNAVFASPHRGRLMLKLPESDVDALVDSGAGQPLAKPNQRPVREWVIVPLDGAATPRAERAYAFALSRRRGGSGSAAESLQRCVGSGD